MQNTGSTPTNTQPTYAPAYDTLFMLYYAGLVMFILVSPMLGRLVQRFSKNAREKQKCE